MNEQAIPAVEQAALKVASLALSWASGASPDEWRGHYRSAREAARAVLSDARNRIGNPSDDVRARAVEIIEEAIS